MPAEHDLGVGDPRASQSLRASVGESFGCENGGAHGDRRQHDGERRRKALILGAGPTEEPEDRDGQRRLLGAGDEHGRAELAERDREREPGGDRERTTDEG